MIIGGADFAQQASSATERVSEYIDANLILMFLWEVAVRSQTPALSVEMLLPDVTNFRLTLKQVLSSDLTEKGTIPSSHCLSNC